MALVTFEWIGTAVLAVREVLAVEDDGTAWLWSTAPAGAERLDRAGTFRAVIDAERVDALRQALDAAGDELPADAGSGAGAVPSGMQPSLVAWPADGRRLEPARGSTLARLAVELRTLADAGPVAVARLRWWPIGPVSLGGGGTPLIRFESAGTEPVVLDVDTADLRLLADAPGALPDWLDPAPGTPADVMAPTGRLLGGSTGPVRIPPGGAGNVSFVGALRPHRAGAARVHARFNGRIALAGPGQDPDRAAARVEIASPWVEVTVET